MYAESYQLKKTELIEENYYCSSFFWKRMNSLEVRTKLHIF